MRILPFWLLLLSALFASCDDPADDPYTQLTASEMSDLSDALPTAVKKIDYVISDERLAAEKPYVIGSETLSELYDESDTLLGYSRLVNSQVGCHDGKCAAIKFVLVLDKDLEYVHLFHPSGTTIGEFYKGLENDTENSVLFDDADWHTLYALLTDPPALLLSLEDRLDMVDTTTGATYPEYHDVVVRGAAYTTYTVLEYLIHTKEIVLEEFKAAGTQ